MWVLGVISVVNTQYCYRDIVDRGREKIRLGAVLLSCELDYN